jgi:hypothetical protein
MHLVFLWYKISNHCNKFVVVFENLHSNHFGKPSKVWSLVYYKEPSNSTQNLYSMTYFSFSKLVPCLLTKVLSRYAIVCSMKNVIIISWNRHVAICLGSLSLSFWHFWNCINEMFSMLDISMAPHLCMVEGGSFKGLWDKYGMMCG